MKRASRDHGSRGKGKPIQRKEWTEFRAEMIERDDAACARCNHGAAQGAVLQVHHKQYIKGRMPWQYRYDECELLCKGCHAAQHGLIRPPNGWEYQGDEDLGDLIGTCDNCGTDIRYVFYIAHPDWEPMTVGEICCDNLTETELASNHMDSIRRFQRRLHTFKESARWRATAGGIAIRQKRMDIEIRPDQGAFRLHINGRKGKRTFSTHDDAKTALFEIVEDGTLELYFAKRPA